jgi:hypothetical protein
LRIHPATQVFTQQVRNGRFLCSNYDVHVVLLDFRQVVRSFAAAAYLPISPQE